MELYDFLNAYGFNSTHRVKKVAKKMSHDDIDDFFDKYRILQGNKTVIPRKGPGFINAFSDSWASGISLKMVKQLCLFTDMIYLKDPILEDYYYWKSIHINPTYVISCPEKESRTAIFLDGFCQSIQRVLRLKPLVEIGIVNSSDSVISWKARARCYIC